MTFLELALHSRRLAFREQRERAELEFKALRESWCSDSTANEQVISSQGSRFAMNLRAVLSVHVRLLADFQDDLEKFLYAVPIRLAKHESDYSWKLEEALSNEIDSLLNGMLCGRSSLRQSLGFIARSYDPYPNLYSRRFLTAEIRRRFYERRSAPRPGFQLTLEYARTLDGVAFEEWLARLLRDAGIPGVTKTQDSRDQGADLIVTIGARVIAIQAKNYQDVVGNGSVQEAFASMHFYNANEAWVVTTSTFSKDAIDLAFRTGVRLIDGSRLMNLPELLCGPAQAVTDQPVPSDQTQVLATSESTHSQPPIPPTESANTNPTAPNALEHRSSSPDVTTAPAGPKPPVKGPLWRDWRVVSLMVGLLVFLSVLLSYNDYASRRRISNERRVQGLSEEGVRGLLERYQDAERSRNAQLLADCYAPEVETYYLHHNVARNDILSDFQSAFNIFTEVDRFEFSKIAFTDVNGTRATATFDREWDYRGTKSFAGNVSEQMIFQNVSGRWLIVSEITLKVNWTRRKSP